MITTHIVYGKPKSDNLSVDLDIGAINMRRNEFSILAGDIYKRIDQDRKDINQNSVCTVLLGDYNLNLASSGLGIATIPDIVFFDSKGRMEPSPVDGGNHIYTMQSELTTLSRNAAGYRIHLPVVKVLVSKEYHDLYDCPIEKLSDPAVCDKIIELSEKIVELYKGLTVDLGDGEGKSASDTLITKILLGTVGCTPAYDRYFKSGLALSNVAQQRYGKKSMMQLVRYYNNNYAEFESFREEISSGRVTYTPMKILDMCFWQIGFDHDRSEN